MSSVQVGGQRSAQVQRKGTKTIDGKDARPIAIVGHSRISGGVEGQCILCERDAPLRLGHVIPRWAVKMLSPGLLYGTVDLWSGSFETQDGAKEYLLCERCEQHLSVAENYLACLSKGSRTDLNSISVRVERGMQLHNVDVSLILRGLTGILFKAHFSSAAIFDGVRLPTYLVARLRDNILRDRYPETCFYASGFKYMDFLGSGLLPRDMLSVGYARDRSFAVFELGGLKLYLTFVKSSRMPFVAQDFYLRRDRPWTIVVGDIVDNTSYERAVTKIDVSRRPINVLEDISPDHDCPCGILPAVAYGAHCLGVWYCAESLLVP